MHTHPAATPELPTPLTAFIGREREVDDVVKLVAQLAQHIAAQVRVHERPDRSLLDSIFEALQPPLRLVVLDNCEHVIEESAQFVAALLLRCGNVSVLATSRESLGIDGERSWLLRGLALQPMPEGGAEQRESEAARLFADRAEAVSKDFRLTESNAPLVRRICSRLDCSGSKKINLSLRFPHKFTLESPAMRGTLAVDV